MNNNTDENNITDIYQLQQKLDNLIKEKKEITLRAQANIENINKKYVQKIQQIQQDNLNTFKNTLTQIIKTLSKIFKITKISSINQNAIISGIKLIHKSLSNTLKKIQ
ncbi:nucleotide exchange factor GrpE [Buchnera aphidicola (Takecallis taiwana)]|uniref:nucleotide exchange factor GrpE n=1 Tax=Buchnera aphidicola TaxID=9 RepID=UPI0031B6918B